MEEFAAISAPLGPSLCSLFSRTICIEAGREDFGPVGDNVAPAATPLLSLPPTDFHRKRDDVLYLSKQLDVAETYASFAMGLRRMVLAAAAPYEAGLPEDLRKVTKTETYYAKTYGFYEIKVEPPASEEDINKDDWEQYREGVINMTDKVEGTTWEMKVLAEVELEEAAGRLEGTSRRDKGQ
ncbi:hypothetical protein B0H67DRAFT_642115 [Lasiosphaeris hirsuta]|uniref:Uncharacterized protein n=1 Tax=Lasiosphaeris hirsuta TaxID=260670 RepID=A0AA40E5G2_9PEZI|nr:hypothetical protein B0H67DRAFT_642115 [Lasiosphaeris hirsuta]